MRNFSKSTVLTLALTFMLSACNSDFSQAPMQLIEEPVNLQEVSAFSSESTAQILSEQDLNRDSQVSMQEAALSVQEMVQIDQDRDGSLTETEIADSIQNEFNNALNFARSLKASKQTIAPETASATGGQVRKLPPSTFKSNKVQLYVDKDEIMPMMLETIRGAKKSIQMDVYLLGGKIGLLLAQELVNKVREGIDLQLTLDPSLGFAGPTQKEIYQVTEFLRQNGVEFKLYPLHLMPLVQDGPLKNMFQIDHNKLYVIDGTTFITGGFNMFDIGITNRDIMMKIEGPTAQEASELLGYEYSMGDNYIAPKVPANVFVVKQAGDSMVKITKTAPFESSTKKAMIEVIDNAKKSLYLAVLEYSDMDVTKALIRAFKRGVDVRVMMDRKNTNDKYAGGIPVPTYFPNILPARDLVLNHVPTKWYDARFKGQELHMKMIVADGEQLIAGSTNFTRQAFTTFRETSVHVAGGTAPTKMESAFRDDWQNHSTYVKKITLRDKIKAKVVEFMDRKYYAWW